MRAFFYGVALQCKLDIRSRSLLITCYVVPLLFFAVMGGIFTSLMPDAKFTLIQSMCIMGVSMGAFVGLPPSVSEIYGSGIKKVYRANGVPLYTGLISMLLSTFVHLMIMCVIIFFTAPIAFGAVVPANVPAFFLSLAGLVVVCLCVGGVLGLFFTNQAKQMMVSQIVFLPSIMLSGIMFPASLLPDVLGFVGKLFPASWGNVLLCGGMDATRALIPLGMMLLVSVVLCAIGLSRKSEA